MKNTLEIMKNDGYFKKGNYGELSSEEETRNYEKAKLFVEKGIIPSWLKEDMEYYSNKNKQLRNLETQNLNS
ncbi:MAG: hypothetical protein IKQ33_01600 [Clostridia bacterium]|nr:hypothetical protein [Clostridia bacterium]